MRQIFLKIEIGVLKGLIVISDIIVRYARRRFAKIEYEAWLVKTKEGDL